MSSEQILLTNWRNLDKNEQEKVIEYMQSLRKKKQSATYQPQTKLGRKMWEIRQQSLGTQPLLTTWEEVYEEINSRRGGISEPD